MAQNWEVDPPVALVTGAAMRVGRELAWRLAEMGAAVAVHYRRSALEAEATVGAIRRRGGRAVALQADLSDGAEVCHELVDAARRHLGPVRVLVNNASLFEPSSLADLVPADWERMLAVNLRAPVFLCQAVVDQLPSEARGHFLQLADWRGEKPVPGHLSYTLSKSALIAMTRLLAQELAPRIQVNAIAPGAILPPPGADAEHLRRLAEQIPLRRAGSPVELADAMEYLLRSDFVTGEVLHVTGGQQL